MDPSSPSSPLSSVHSPPSEYPQSVENTSQEPISNGSSRSRSSFSPFGSSNGSPTIVAFDSERREEGGRRILTDREYLDLFMKRCRCVRSFVLWNMCVDKAIGDEDDHTISCHGISKSLRDCVRKYEVYS